MSDEREIQTPGGLSFKATAEDRKANEVSVDEQIKYRARLATVLDRGVTNDRLAVNLPKHLHGEWVVNDSVEVARASLLGFEDGSEYIKNRTIHHDGTKPGVGDVVFMVQPMWQHELVVKERERRFNEMHSPKKKRQAEEEKFNAEMKGAGLPVIEESNVVQRTVSVTTKK